MKKCAVILLIAVYAGLLLLLSPFRVARVSAQVESRLSLDQVQHMDLHVPAHGAPCAGT